MSELRQALNDVITDRQSFTGDQVTNLRTGRPFTAEIEEIQDTDLNTELGRDPREQFILRVQDRVEAAVQHLNDRVQFVVLGEVVTAQIVRRSDNRVRLQAEFGCMQIVTGKDL